MQITVFGASGKVGRLVVQRLLDEQHSVVAFVHQHSNLPDHPQLRIVRGDIHESADVAAAIQGSDAVISTLGSWHTSDKNILSSAMERLIPAMRATQCRRIVSLTGAGAFSADDHPTAFDRAQHALLNAAAPKILRDGEDHIRLLTESGLDWTVVRSPVMTESGTTAYKFTTSFPLPWQTIHRHAVAACMVALISEATYLQQAPFISRS